MKVFILILPCLIFLTDAFDVTNEDIDSPLVSYLFAKVQKLEASKEINVRTTRDVEERSVNTSEDNKKTKRCPQVVSYQMG